MKSNEIAQVGVIAAVYAACTLIALLFLGSLAWRPVQFRVSEALCVLALFTPAAVPGLTLGCAIANIANIAFSGTGMLGLLDVIFGSLATCAGAAFTWKMRGRPAVALAGLSSPMRSLCPPTCPSCFRRPAFTPYRSPRYHSTAHGRSCISSGLSRRALAKRLSCMYWGTH